MTLNELITIKTEQNHSCHRELNLKAVGKNIHTVHKARKTSLSFAIAALCLGGKLTLTVLARAAFSDTSVA